MKQAVQNTTCSNTKIRILGIWHIWKYNSLKMIYKSWSSVILPLLTFKLINTCYIVKYVIAQLVKNLPAMQETRFDPWVGKILWRRAWLPSPVLLPRESHGQRSLTGYSPWGHKEADTTEQLTLSLFSVGFVSFQTVSPESWGSKRLPLSHCEVAASR